MVRIIRRLIHVIAERNQLRVQLADLGAEYDLYRRDTDRLIGELRAELQDAREARSSHITNLRSRLAQAEDRVRETKLSYVGTNRRSLPEPVQALVDWHLRKPMTAVLPLPSRESVRVALAGSQQE
jgi:hypothetical protein